MPIGTKCGMVKNVESNKFRMRRHNVDWLKMSKIRKYLKSLFFEKTIRYYNKSTKYLPGEICPCPHPCPCPCPCPWTRTWTGTWTWTFCPPLFVENFSNMSLKDYLDGVIFIL
jgi:hypothetical protein